MVTFVLATGTGGHQAFIPWASGRGMDGGGVAQGSDREPPQGEEGMPHTEKGERNSQRRDSQGKHCRVHAFVSACGSAHPARTAGSQAPPGVTTDCAR
jgi:hypothetical protein